MKRVFALTVVSLAVIGAIGIVFAGPERYSAKEVAPPVVTECEWTGWYVGGHVGYGGGNATWMAGEDLSEINATTDPSGIFAGLQAGYNRQISPWFVLGFEVSGSWSDAEDSITFQEETESTIEPNTWRNEMDWMGTLGLRAGFTGMNNRALFYGKVGGAITRWNHHLIHDETVEEGRSEFDRFGQDEVRVSPMFGLGIEYKFNCHWSAKVEYQHLFLGEQTVQGDWVEDFEPDEKNGIIKRLDLSYDSVQFGVNYHF